MGFWLRFLCHQIPKSTAISAVNIAQGKKSVNTSNTPILFAYSGKTLRNGQVTSPKIKDIAVYSTKFYVMKAPYDANFVFHLFCVNTNAFRAFELLILVNRSFLFKETFATLKSFLQHSCRSSRWHVVNFKNSGTEWEVMGSNVWKIKKISAVLAVFLHFSILDRVKFTGYIFSN